MRKQKYKHIVTAVLILPLVFLMYGCPYSSSYKIDREPTVLADDTFVGKWATVISTATDNQPLKMLVSKKNDYEYYINFTGHINGIHDYISGDTLKTTAFFSEAASRRFLNIDIKGQTYIAEFIYKNDMISILPLCEHFTSKVIKTDDELKKALEYHFRTRLYPLYDDDFSIRNLRRVKDME